MVNKLRWLAWCFPMLVLPAPALAVDPGFSFTALHSIGGGDAAIPRGVSGDGNVVFGYSSDTGQPQQAFRWTAAGGIANLGTLGAGFTCEARGASFDGSVIVGNSGGAFRWTASGGMTDMGVFPPGNTQARATSADGSVVVGYSGMGSSTGDGNRAFRWTPSGGYQNLGLFPGAQQASAISTSANGSVVVGWGGSSSSGVRPFRWTAAGGMQDLGNLSGDTVGYATGVSADGSTVLGYSGTSTNITLPGHRIFLWTAQGGKQVVPTLPNTTNAYANSISGDGSTVLGINHTSTRGNRLVLWNTQLGVIDLTDYLGAHGINLSRWTTGLFDPGGLSYDGRTIVGNGYCDNGTRQGPQGWVATIPAPSAASVLGACGLAMFRRRRGRA